MGFHLIKGTFHVKGYSPDGDSIRFRAVNEANWGLLGLRHLNINSQKDVQVRLGEIDTVETHFCAPGGEVHQPRSLAHVATDFLLRQLQIDDVVWDRDHRNILQAKDGTPGYILTKHKDTNGRPVSFVFTGTPPEQDGSNIFLDGKRLKQSLNYQTLAVGNAYPTYYQGIFSELRKTLTEAATKARTKNLGLYKLDKTNSGVLLDKLAVIIHEQPILPKLFRRLAEFIGGEDSPNLDGFLDWLATRDTKPVMIVSTHSFTHFYHLIEVNGQTVRLLELPENLIFTP
jgi:endonuclease YncB( thermonuclease family)